MPSFKPKAAKKILVCKKYTASLDGKHKEFVNEFTKNEFDVIPRLKEEKYSLSKQLEDKTKLTIDEIMEIKDCIKEIDEHIKELKRKKKNIILITLNIFLSTLKIKKASIILKKLTK